MCTRKWPTLFSVLALAFMTACGGGGGESSTPAPRKESGGGSSPASTGSGAGFGTGSVRGKVVFEGVPPKSSSIKMDADPYCTLQHPDGAKKNQYDVNTDGTLKWVFVYVKDGLTASYKAPKEVVTLDQKGCVYEPHVFGIMAGQTLNIVNSDETLHNIHSFPKESRQFNLAMPRAGMELEQKFRNPEVMVRIKCDVHPWMLSYAGVLAHPFHSTTRDDGQFDLERLPAGTYTIEAWHEAGGTQTQSVTVGDGETKEITFSFKAA